MPGDCGELGSMASGRCSAPRGPGGEWGAGGLHGTQPGSQQVHSQVRAIRGHVQPLCPWPGRAGVFLQELAFTVLCGCWKFQTLTPRLVLENVGILE